MTDQSDQLELDRELRDARDKLESALKLAPQHPELLRLMQEVKANLYICLKHGM